MSGKSVVYIDGSFFNSKEAKISVFDHAVLYGDGVYDTLRVYSGKALSMTEHLKRLYESADFMSLKIPVNRIELKQILKETYLKSGLTDAFIRIMVTRGAGEMGVDPRNVEKPTLIVIVSERKIKEVRGVKLIVSSIRNRLYPLLQIIKLSGFSFGQNRSNKKRSRRSAISE